MRMLRTLCLGWLHTSTAGGEGRETAGFREVFLFFLTVLSAGRGVAGSGFCSFTGLIPSSFFKTFFPALTMEDVLPAGLRLPFFEVETAVGVFAVFFITFLVAFFISLLFFPG